MPRLPSRTPVTHPLRLFAVAMLMMLLFNSGVAIADELSEVNRLHRAGQTGAAMMRAERFLADKPDDTQMRFMQFHLCMSGPSR